MPPDLELLVDGRRYSGWKSVSVMRSAESISGSFSLGVSDRWGGQELPWPIAEEDECSVLIGGRPVITGYVDQRSISISAGARTLSYSGRDRAAALVDCSVVGERVYRGLTLDEVARRIAAPHGVGVTVQGGLRLRTIARVKIQPGDTPYDTIQRLAVSEGVLVVSDGIGGIHITRSDAVTRATPLVLGVNILSISVEYDGSERYRTYLLSTQVPGTDEASGDATRIKAESSDESVRRPSRVLLIRPEQGVSTADARRRADWEARQRAAKAETVTVSVQGWTQPGGELWPLLARVRVQARAAGVDGDLVISQIDHQIDDGGQITTLRLMRPDAFDPEPQAVVRGSGAAWKELAKGAL